jgi:hypothetical protein
MHKLSVLGCILLTGLFITNISNAQSRNNIDAGISTHNYKHPNKAAQAKSQGENTIRVPSMQTVDRYSKMRQGGGFSTTPKYAPRPATLVVTRTYVKEKVDINPLISPRNYKTPLSSEVKNAEVAGQTLPGDSIYPNQD